MSKHIWKTQTGEEMDIEEMDDQHLLNSIHMLERKAEGMKQRELSAGYSVMGTLQGEQALWDIERDIDRLEETPALEFLEAYMPAYPAMKKLAKHRGLM